MRPEDSQPRESTKAGESLRGFAGVPQLAPPKAGGVGSPGGIDPSWGEPKRSLVRRADSSYAHGDLEEVHGEAEVRGEAEVHDEAEVHLGHETDPGPRLLLSRRSDSHRKPRSRRRRSLVDDFKPVSIGSIRWGSSADFPCPTGTSNESCVPV